MELRKWNFASFWFRRIIIGTSYLSLPEQFVITTSALSITDQSYKILHCATAKLNKNKKNVEIQNFEPKKMTGAYVCMKISEYPPGACLLQSKNEDKDQESIQSCSTPDPGHNMEM